jgi:hypothetical protein
MDASSLVRGDLSRLCSSLGDPVLRVQWFAMAQSAEVRAGQLCKVRNNIEVEDVIPIHEHDLTSFRGIQFIPEPIPRSLGDFTSSNNECAVDKNALARLWIEDFVPEHHQCLIVNLRNISG